MDSNELKSIISQGESTKVQLKISADDAYKVATEMVAFSNSLGGVIIIGVDDKSGEVKGLSFPEIQQTNSLLANAASENVKPAILIQSETIQVDGKNLIVSTIAQGKDKPYKDNKGIIWVKNGSDKRKVFSNAELRVMMQSCGTLSADRDSVDKTSYKDISEKHLRRFLYEKYTEECNKSEIYPNTLNTTEISDIVKAIDLNMTIEQLLANIEMMDEEGRLTLSGLLLLGKSIQKYKPVFTVKCVSFVGNSIATNEFRDKMPDSEVEGNLLDQYNAMLSFINRNLKSVQVEENFNSIARLEIPLTVFVELGVNALLHRDFYQTAPIRVFIFDDRVEIHSPGVLPYSVTEQSIKSGISKPRNELLFNNAKYMLPYTGVGSGIVRAMKSYDHISFDNNHTTEEFVVTIRRQEVIEGEVISSPNSSTELATVYVADYDNVYDSDYVKKILSFALMPQSRKSIMDMLGLSIHSDNYKKHIAPLLKKGLLSMTLPDKPKSKSQRYFTTEKGRILIEDLSAYGADIEKPTD